MKKKAIFIVGPTAVGKTAIALKIAEQIGAEIVSADSRQVYKYLDIGTAKPDFEDLQRVPHWFINDLYPNESFSAGEFGEKARKVAEEIFSRGKEVLVVGGSGLYIRAMMDGFFEGDVKDEKVREALNKRLEVEGVGKLYEDLKKVDPEGAGKVHINDKQRILRMLEIFLVTGRPLSELQLQTPPPPAFESVVYGLAMPREMLYERINSRVDRMIDMGLIAEVANIQVMGYHPRGNALNTVGYKEVFDYFDGKYTFAELVEKIKTNSRRYAKRQLTWFKADDRIKWFDVSTREGTKELIEDILSHYRE
jgi:tRNA dimethylallyltransferase